MFNSDFEYAKYHKQEYGMTPLEARKEAAELVKRLTQQCEESIVRRDDAAVKQQIHAYYDVQINWDIIRREELNGYDWPCMPWLPAPVERHGKTWHELNKITFERRESYIKAHNSGS